MVWVYRTSLRPKIVEIIAQEQTYHFERDHLHGSIITQTDIVERATRDRGGTSSHSQGPLHDPGTDNRPAQKMRAHFGEVFRRIDLSPP